MRHLAAFFLASALIVSASCAHSPPIVNDVVICGGHTVQPADVTEAYTDLTTQNWGDLAALGIRLGWDVVACVIDDLSAAHPELKPAGEKFKSDHSEQIRKASAPSVSLRSPTLEKVDQASNAPPPAAPAASTGNAGGDHVALVEARHKGSSGVATRAGGQFTYAGETVSHAQAICEAKCGSPDAIGSPGSNCLCWRGPRDARGGWVAIQ